MNGNAVLSAQQVAALSPAEQDALQEARRNAALLQAMAQEALANASSRFSAIQLLINAIPQATDQKGILDLEARIAAEQGMLQNEQTKLNVLGQAAQGDEWARRQRTRERAVADIGSLRTLARDGAVTRSDRLQRVGTLMGFFAEFSAWLNSLLATYIGDQTARVAAALEPAVVALATIYVMVWGFMQLTGKIDEPFADGLKRIITLVVVLAVALSSGSITP